ncbi:MAG: c-type cytochrome domain-containing protein, partial [Candidatus Hydrogenedentales bacterium]
MPKYLAQIALLGLAGLAGAAAGAVTYEDLRPIFERRCAGCHWPGADKLQRSGLDLSTRATLLAGGKNGDAIIPGNAQDSALVQMIEYRLDPEMPPMKDADPLPAEEIARIRAWIDGGALGAEGADAQERVPPVAAADDAPPALLDAAIVDATPVTALAWSPDGKYLAEGRLQTVVIRGGETGAEATRLTGHAEQVRALAFSPDGALLAAGGGVPSESGEVVVWRTSDWTRVATLGEHRDSVLAAAFSPDGKHLATASYDKSARVWSTDTWTTVHNLAEHVDAIYAVAWAPDNATLATGAGDRTVKLWSLAEGKRLLTLSDATDAVHALAYAPDGRHIAAGAADKMIYVWDLAKSGADFSQSALTSGVLEHSTFAHENAVLALAYSPTGDKLYSAAQDGRVKAWDAATMSEATVFERQPDWALALAVHPDGGRIAVGRYDAAAPI